MTALQNRSKGTITLPASLRNKYNLEEGGTVTIDGLLFIFYVRVSRSAGFRLRSTDLAHLRLFEAALKPGDQ